MVLWCCFVLAWHMFLAPTPNWSQVLFGSLSVWWRQQKTSGPFSFSAAAVTPLTHQVGLSQRCDASPQSLRSPGVCLPLVAASPFTPLPHKPHLFHPRRTKRRHRNNYLWLWKVTKRHIQSMWGHLLQGTKRFMPSSPYAQWTWAPALEWRLASMMEKASCSSPISVSLFSSRKDTSESLMSTTSSICWRTRSSSDCCSGVLSTD